MHDGRGPLVYWECEQPSDCLVRAYVPAIQVVRDLVQTIVVALQGEHGLVAPLVDILEYVLDGLGGGTEFHVDVGVKDPGEERIVWNDPLLSISISLFPCLILTVWPPCPGARLLYSGYQSWPECVSAKSCLGNFLVHLPSFMQGSLGLKRPWTMHLVMMACRAGSLSTSGISVEMREPIWSWGILFVSQTKR